MEAAAGDAGPPPVPEAESRPATASAAAEGWVVWVSVDPRGQGGRPGVVLYPRSAAALIERAHRRGDACVGLGPALFNAVVHLQGPQPIQRTAPRGRRDVQRVELSEPECTVSVRVVDTTHGWRVAPPNAEAEVATVSVPAGAALSLGDLDEGGGEAAGDRLPDDPPGSAPLWEWCQELVFKPQDAAQVPESEWGVYSAEQNEEIERARAGGAPGTVIVVGVREFQIVFGPHGEYSWQIDPKLHKTRMVRRRTLPVEERDARLRPAAPAAHAHTTCAICCEDFAHTAAMPTVEVPRCRHVFHQACVQQIADRNSECPCCRGAVDWPSLLPSLLHRATRRSRA